MTKKKTDGDLVLELVKEEPGLTDSCYRWKRGGGVVANGRRVGGIHDLLPQDEAKMNKVQQRLHELKVKGLVYQDMPAHETDSPGLGFWPTGTKARSIRPQRPAEAPAMGGQERGAADHGPARAGIAGIKGILG